MITGMNHVTLAVKDISKSFAFYHDVLELLPLVRWHKGAYFLVNDFWFCLNADDNCKPNSCYTHYAFTVTEENFEIMSQKIIASGAKLFKENTSPGKSLYFLDPDGHKLEIHAGNWRERVYAKKKDIGQWQNVEWFV